MWDLFLAILELFAAIGALVVLLSYLTFLLRR